MASKWEQGYGIKEYHNVDEINIQLKNLVSQPMAELKSEELKSYLNWFETHCKKSKEITDVAKNRIPGGVQHNLAFNFPHPLVITKAKGAHLWDIDGNKYIDFLQAGGPTVLGSNIDSVKEKAIEVINECGPVTGLFHEYEYKIADIICENMIGVDMFRMLGSGTESVMAALRVARNYTRNKKVIKIGGDYHGWSDQMVYSLHLPNSYWFEAHGIPRGCYKHTQQAQPNDIKDLEKQLKKNKFMGGTAAVIVEPVGPESGTRPVDYDYNQQVRELCDKYGALMIFDEVVTGFRIGPGGAQGYFDIKPDITIFGKVVAGGYPAAGGIGGPVDIMSLCAAGVQTGMKRAYVGGTLSANPLSCTAGYYAIKEIIETEACKKAGMAGNQLTEGLKKLIEDYKLPYVAYNQGSICHLECSGAMAVPLNPKKFWTIKKVIKDATARKHMMEEMGAAYTSEGIITLAGSRLYTSAADSKEVIQDALDGFERVFQKVIV